MSDKAEQPEVVWKQLVKKDTTPFEIYGVQCEVNNQRYSVGLTKDFYGVRRGEMPIGGLETIHCPFVTQNAIDLIVRIDYLEQIKDYKESKLLCDILTQLVVNTRGFGRWNEVLALPPKAAGLVWSVVNIFDVLQDNDLSSVEAQEALKELKKTPFFKHLVISSLEGN